MDLDSSDDIPSLPHESEELIFHNVKDLTEEANLEFPTIKTTSTSTLLKDDLKLSDDDDNDNNDVKVEDKDEISDLGHQSSNVKLSSPLEINDTTHSLQEELDTTTFLNNLVDLISPKNENQLDSNGNHNDNKNDNEKDDVQKATPSQGIPSNYENLFGSDDDEDEDESPNRKRIKLETDDHSKLQFTGLLSLSAYDSSSESEKEKQEEEKEGKLSKEEISFKNVENFNSSKSGETSPKAQSILESRDSMPTQSTPFLGTSISQLKTSPQSLEASPPPLQASLPSLDESLPLPIKTSPPSSIASLTNQNSNSETPRPNLLSIKLPDVMHHTSTQSSKLTVDSEQNCKSANNSSPLAKISFLSTFGNSHPNDDNDYDLPVESSATNLEIDESSDEGGENDDDDDEELLLKALGSFGNSASSKQEYRTPGICASGNYRHEDRGEPSGMDDDDDDSMDDDTLVDGRNRAEDLEFKTSFSLNSIFTVKDVSSAMLADRDPKTLTKQEQERLKEQLQLEERERMQ